MVPAPNRIAERQLDRRFAGAESVANAICYEGYVLYPYRASAAKNRFRWQWGVLVPPAMADATGERSFARAEVVLHAGRESRLHVRARGLVIQERSVLERIDGAEAPVASLDDGTNVWTSFDEGSECAIEVTGIELDTGVSESRDKRMHLSAATSEEPVGDVATREGRVVRRRLPIEAHLTVETTPIGDGLTRASVTMSNESAWSKPGAGRDEVVRHSLASVHLLMAVDNGRFVSSLNPSQDAVEAVAGCTNEGVFPVLVGDDDDVVLASPIILYDHPAVAPESQGDMFDATEIDEILALRVRTLSDEEKREARGTDARAAAVVDRCDAMDIGDLETLHGAFRPINGAFVGGGAPKEHPGGGGGVGAADRPWWDPEADAAFNPWTDTIEVGGVQVGNGTKVRLRPRRRADAQDLFVEGREATVAGVLHDVGGEVYLAVSVDGLDGELHASHGRYLYFSPDEVELAGGAGDSTGSLQPRVLVAGVGNIFLGDDGFGVEVVNRVDATRLPAGVKVADFGIRGVHLAYELLEGYDTLVLIDAVSRGAPPGTLSLIEHTGAGEDGGGTLAAMDAHGMDPAAVLAMTTDMGGSVGRVLVLACEAAQLDEGIGLSPPVAEAVPAALEALGDLLTSLIDPAPASQPPTHSMEEVPQ